MSRFGLDEKTSGEISGPDPSARPRPASCGQGPSAMTGASFRPGPFLYQCARLAQSLPGGVSHKQQRYRRPQQEQPKPKTGVGKMRARSVERKADHRCREKEQEISATSAASATSKSSTVRPRSPDASSSSGTVTSEPFFRAPSSRISNPIRRLCCTASHSAYGIFDVIPLTMGRTTNNTSSISSKGGAASSVGV